MSTIPSKDELLNKIKNKTTAAEELRKKAEEQKKKEEEDKKKAAAPKVVEKLVYKTSDNIKYSLIGLAVVLSIFIGVVIYQYSRAQNIQLLRGVTQIDYNNNVLVHTKEKTYYLKNEMDGWYGKDTLKVVSIYHRIKQNEVNTFLIVGISNVVSDTSSSLSMFGYNILDHYGVDKK